MLILNGVRQGGGIDTSDATATPDKIIAPYTAYVNGEKIIGMASENIFQPFKTFIPLDNVSLNYSYKIT